MSAPIVYTMGWRELADIVDKCDAVIVDAPYSARTHEGHAAAISKPKKGEEYKAKKAAKDGKKWVERPALRQTMADLDYACWDEAEVNAFVDAWSARCSGWIVSLTDHHLAPFWASAMERNKRLVFSPIACVELGSTVRMNGDGPAQWSCWAIVSRPKAKAFSKWGSLPGAYVVPPGKAAPKKLVTGGKQPWIMESLVRDYSRPGDLVVDPCCGGGTTLTAAIKHSRRCIGSDISPEHAAIAREAVEAESLELTLASYRANQLPLLNWREDASDTSTYDSDADPYGVASEQARTLVTDLQAREVAKEDRVLDRAP